MTSQVILAATLSGMASSIFLIRKVKTTLQYKSVLLVCIILLYVGLFVTFLMDIIVQLIFARKPDKVWIIYMVGICTGFFKIPISAIILAYASEAFYPIGEGSATGYLVASSKTFGFVLGLGSAALLKSARSTD